MQLFIRSMSDSRVPPPRSSRAATVPQSRPTSGRPNVPISWILNIHVRTTSHANMSSLFCVKCCVCQCRIIRVKTPVAMLNQMQINAVVCPGRICCVSCDFSSKLKLPTLESSSFPPGGWEMSWPVSCAECRTDSRDARVKPLVLVLCWEKTSRLKDFGKY